MEDNTGCDRLSGIGWRLPLLVLLTLVVAVTAGGAAGSTTVGLTSPNSVAVSETTTVDVVVADADHGVGAYNVTVALTDPSIARITDVDLKGNPSEKTRLVTIASDGSSVTILAALMDTEDTGAVTIASVTVRGEHAGATDVDLTVAALGDERGHSYVTESEHTSLTVRGDGANGDGAPAPESDGSAATGSGAVSPTSQLRRPIVGFGVPSRGHLVILSGVALVALVSLRRIR